MRKLRIVSDSSSDILELENVDFAYAPMKIITAERLQAMIKEKFDKVQIEIHKLRGLCSFYAEKGGLLVGFEKY